VQKNKNLLEKKIGTNNFFLQEKDILNLLEREMCEKKIGIYW